MIDNSESTPDVRTSAIKAREAINSPPRAAGPGDIFDSASAASRLTTTSRHQKPAPGETRAYSPASAIRPEAPWDKSQSSPHSPSAAPARRRPSRPAGTPSARPITNAARPGAVTPAPATRHAATPSPATIRFAASVRKGNAIAATPSSAKRTPGAETCSPARRDVVRAEISPAPRSGSGDHVQPLRQAHRRPEYGRSAFAMSPCPARKRSGSEPRRSRDIPSEHRPELPA